MERGWMQPQLWTLKPRPKKQVRMRIGLRRNRSSRLQEQSWPM
jgi:hypothetical protein